MVISIIIMTRRKVRSKAPPRGIIHFVQSELAGSGGVCGEVGCVGGDRVGCDGKSDFDDASDAVMKALTALQSL